MRKNVGKPLLFSDIQAMKAISLIGILFIVLSSQSFGQNAGTGAPAGTPAAPGISTPTYPVETGLASWYGPEFAGKPTASGELFDPTALTAAHPTLPFGTLVRLTNKNNGKQVTVRINDRGPFVANRNIDLSQAAAERLDMLKTGTIPVILEVLPSGGTAEAAKTAAKPAPMAVQPTTAPGPQGGPAGAASMSNGKSYRIQVGSFKLSRNAVDAINRIKAVGLEPAYERFQDLYRVVVAQVPQGNLETVRAQLGSAGFTNLLIREEISVP
jgi:rare lipoprotein A